MLLDHGFRITHKYFTSDEYMVKHGHGYMFEDECLCTVDQFWANRQDKGWETGWSIHPSSPTPPTLEVNENHSDEIYMIDGRYYHKRGIHCDQFGYVHKIVEGIGFSDIKLTRDNPYSFVVKMTTGKVGGVAAIVKKDVSKKTIIVEQSDTLSLTETKNLTSLCLGLRAEFILSDSDKFVISQDLKVYKL